MKIKGLFLIFLLSLLSTCQKEEANQIPEKRILQFMTAQSLYYRGEIEQAMSILESVYQENPDFLRNTNLYARALYYSGKTENAVTIWKTLCRKDKFHIDAVKYLSRFYLNEGRPQEAQELIMNALSYSSEDSGLVYLLAEARIAQNELSEGLVLLEQASILIERNCEIYLKQASVYQSYGYYDKALESVEKGAALLNEDHPLFNSIAALQQKLLGEIP